jgi:hypothetical protein
MGDREQRPRSGQACLGDLGDPFPGADGRVILRDVSVLPTVRGIVGHAADPGLRWPDRLVALALGTARMLRRRRVQLGWLTLAAVWLLR